MSYNQSYRPNRSRNSFSSSNTRRKFTGQYIGIDKFISKAQSAEAIEPYQSTNRFGDFKINDVLKSNILAKGYDLPTEIQDKTIPQTLLGKDIIGIANTGTGKTAAFLIPLINKLAYTRGQRVLIMTPTRELAEQIDQEFRYFARGLNLYSTLVIGGANISQQIARLRRFPQFVIGTPGRLKDLVGRQHLDLSQFNSLVLDEADRMLDMGFINDIKMLLGEMNPVRQTLFFSATMSVQIQNLTRSFLNDPVTVSIKKQDVAANIEQNVVHVENESRKIEQLHDLLIKPEFNKVLIFGQTKRGVENLSNTLEERGFKSTCIHGNKAQPKRQKALNSFRNDDVQILVATDVAARGLDIPDVSHVINYDVPMTYDDYVHRIGRTGRANKKGNALTFVLRRS